MLQFFRPFCLICPSVRGSWRRPGLDLASFDAGRVEGKGLNAWTRLLSRALPSLSAPWVLLLAVVLGFACQGQSLSWSFFTDLRDYLDLTTRPRNKKQTENCRQPIGATVYTISGQRSFTQLAGPFRSPTGSVSPTISGTIHEAPRAPAERVSSQCAVRAELQDPVGGPRGPDRGDILSPKSGDSLRDSRGSPGELPLKIDEGLQKVTMAPALLQ